MADNIINPGDLAEKGRDSAEEIIPSEQPEQGLEKRFSDLVSVEEGGEELKRTNPLPPLQFSELEQENDNQPPVETSGNEQADLTESNEEFVRSYRVENEDVDQIDRVDQVGLLGEEAFSGSAVVGENVDALPEAGTLGDRILRGMQSVRERVEDGARQVESHIDPARETMSMREMFHTQWTMSNLMITEDYIGKVVSKGTQAFDTLLRNQ